MLAPSWIVELNNLAKAQGRRLGHLDLSLVTLKSIAPGWRQRQHPDSELINETIILEISEKGSFELKLNYPEKLPPSLGIWMGSDGDNSGASYTLRIDELRLQFYDGDK